MYLLEKQISYSCPGLGVGDSYISISDGSNYWSGQITNKQLLHSKYMQIILLVIMVAVRHINFSELLSLSNYFYGSIRSGLHI